MNNSLLGAWLPNFTGDLEITAPGQKVVPAAFIKAFVRGRLAVCLVSSLYAKLSYQL